MHIHKFKQENKSKIQIPNIRKGGGGGEWTGVNELRLYLNIWESLDKVDKPMNEDKNM